jgi:7-cyano-7-deazaguanine synthase
MEDDIMSRALVLLSGGQDSTTCLYWARRAFETVEAIGFDYGQMHVKEIEQARQIARAIKVPFTIRTMKGLLATSSLIEHGDHNASSYLDHSLPASFTSGRNLLFLTIAASYAAEQGINDLITGVCQTDYSGYPDCRRVTIDAMQLALTLGCGVGDIRIHTPLMYQTKAETWKLAKELGCLEVIIRDTLTDYDGDMTLNEWGRGNANNPASQLRRKGFYEAKEKGWV